jgi:hypothetical protein
MQSIATVLGLLAIACVLWAVVASVRMGVWLAAHGVKVHWFFFRGLMPWYVHRYRKMTEEVEGGTGSLFPQFVVPINLALLFAVAALVALSAAGR